LKTDRVATWLLGGAAIALAAAALNYGRPVPDRPAASVLSAGPRVSIAQRWRTRTDSLKRGESLVAVLQRAGVTNDDAMTALRAARTIDPRKVPTGTTITTSADSANAAPSEIVFHLAVDRLVRLSRTATNGWSEKVERLAWTTDTVAVAGVIRTTLTGAIASGAVAFPERVRTELAYALADILEYRIDLSRDLQPGDSVHVLLERQRANGMVRPGQILAARLFVEGKNIETVHFQGRDAANSYFDGDGKSMRAAFLRAPLAFRRISSVFGARKHPILGVWKQHAGTDYAAAAGTPVRALGNGVVIFAGWKGGYGNVVEIRHPNGMVTRYGHMRAFAEGIKRGASVAISRTIGFVGMTGLATGPHLHFEVLVNGQSRDSRIALKNITGEPLSTRDLVSFTSLKNKLFASMSARLAANVATIGGTMSSAAVDGDGSFH
jgi:murein DD-endopeptidase MepM/ murein hydrolase activator NlpD